MIVEPGQWDIQCDWRGDSLKHRPIGDPQSYHELIEWAQKDGWVLLSRGHFCGRECYRRLAATDQNAGPRS